MTSTPATGSVGPAATPDSRHPVAERHAALLADLATRVVAADGAEQTTVHTPLTGQRIATLSRSTTEDVDRAVAAARAAQPGWATRTPRERARVLARLADLVVERQAEGLDLAQLETGKSRSHAFDEIAEVAINARWIARHAPAALRSRRHPGLTPLTIVTELHHPKGVVGVISPWNYPYTLSVSDAVAALAAGNAVVLKPDSRTPFTALWGARLLADAGLPDGLFQIVHGAGTVVGTRIIDTTDHLCFTGSTATGRRVAERAAARLVGASLELGGKNAVYVADDADLDRAAEAIVRDSFGNTGHTCISMERLLLHERIADPFLDRFLPRVRALRLGAGFDYDADLGCIASPAQFDTLVAHIADATGRGAVVLAGGRARPDLGPLFHEPTVLDRVPPEAVCATAETFGPLVAVRRVRDDDEAVAVMNGTEFGLHASVWSGDRLRAGRIARQVVTGTVGVNEAYTLTWASVAAPMGGRRQSGLGRRHGVVGIRRFTETQSVVHQHLIGATPGCTHGCCGPPGQSACPGRPGSAPRSGDGSAHRPGDGAAPGRHRRRGSVSSRVPCPRRIA
ncbi:MAG: succinic semialdehyde dehydrogenase [Kineosporiaceae bacterium]